jgi:hypothetical protein
MPTTWTRHALDLIRAWQPPRRCRVSFRIFDDAIVLTLTRNCGCRVRRWYPRTGPVLGIVDQLGIMAVDMNVYNGNCQYDDRLIDDLQLADIIFCESMRWLAGWPRGRRRKRRPMK